MLANGGPAGLQICPVPGSLPPLLRPGQRRVDAPPFQLDFEVCMHKLHCQVQISRRVKLGSKSFATGNAQTVVCILLVKVLLPMTLPLLKAHVAPAMLDLDTQSARARSLPPLQAAKSHGDAQCALV